MSDLQSCYFCSTPENVQAYAVIPPRFTPDGDDPQSAVLCGQCKTKLLQVIEPLTEQLGDGAAGSKRSAGETVRDTSDPTTPNESGDSAVTIASSNEGRRSDDAETAGSEGSETAGNGDSETAGNEPSESAQTAASGPAGESTPPSYRRAMRMLSNREFPLDRSEVESMLAGAYELERHELNAVLDHAVETGRLREEDGQFYET